MIQSSVWEAALAEGKAEGALQALREFCREQVRKHHPAMFPEAASLIEGCTDVDRLKAWVIEASDHDDAGFARLLGLG